MSRWPAIEMDFDRFEYGGMIDYTAQIEFSDLTRATETLRATNAFHEPDSDYRLTLPTGLNP